MVRAVCHIEGVSVPEKHRGYWDNTARCYVDGLLNRVEKYLNEESYKSYSYLLIKSQTLRYRPAKVYEFLESDDVKKRVDKHFKAYKKISEDFHKKYNKHFV